MDNELKKGGPKGSGSRERDTQQVQEGAMPGGGSHQPKAETSAKDSIAQSVGDLKDKANQVLDDVKDKTRQAQSSATDAYRRATGYTRDGYERASTWASDRYDNAARTAQQAHKRSASELERVRRSAEDLVTHNPVMIGVAGLAAGLLIGALLPRTQRENEAFGRLSDDLREQGKRYASDLVRQGKERVVDALDQGKEQIVQALNSEAGQGSGGSSASRRSPP